MTEVATIKFEDLETEEEAVVIVQSIGGDVRICLSLKSGGDVEATMPADVAMRLAESIRTSLQRN
jgi:hypothetical protein